MARWCINVHLKNFNSKEMRHFLEAHRFSIFIYDGLTNEYYDAKDRHVNISNRKIRFVCIYNGKEKPQEEVFKRLNQDQSVIKFKIEKQVE